MKTPPMPLLGAFLLFGYFLTASDAQEEPHRSRHLLGKSRSLEVVATIESVLMSGRLLGFATTYENTSSTAAYTITFFKMADPLAVVFKYGNYDVGTEDMSSAVGHGGDVCVHLLPAQRFVTYLPLSTIRLGPSETIPLETRVYGRPRGFVSEGLVYHNAQVPSTFFSTIEGGLGLASGLPARSDLPAPTSQRLRREYSGSWRLENNPLEKKQIGSLEVTASLLRCNGRSSGLCLRFSKPPLESTVMRLLTRDNPELAEETSDGRVVHLSSPELRSPTGLPRMYETLSFNDETELFIPFTLYDWKFAKEHGERRLVGLTLRMAVTEWPYRQPNEVTGSEIGELKFDPLNLTEADMDFDAPPMPEGSALMPFSKFLYPWWPDAGPSSPLTGGSPRVPKAR